ncbi:cytochrome P450 2C5-like [Gastrophryne carolinensis]
MATARSKASKAVQSGQLGHLLIRHLIDIQATAEITAAMVFIDPITILMCVMVILFLANVYKNQKNVKNLPPGPKPLPFIGNVLAINMRKPQETFMELSKIYGNVFTVHIGMTKIVVLCGYDTIKDALVNHAEVLADRPWRPLIEKISRNNGVIFSNGENWKVMRRFTLSTLRDYGMGKKTIEDKINEEAECLVQTFRSYNGKPFHNHFIINAAVANIIISILLSQRFEYEDPTIKKLMHLVNENVKLVGTRIGRLYDSFPFLIGLIGGHKKIVKNNYEIYEFIRETFTRQRKELDVNNQLNLIDTFLAKQQEKPESTQYYHDGNLTSLVSNLFAAGMETTSTTLRWGILLMMKYPHIQKKVKDEIERVIGTAQPRWEHRKQMPYTDAVIHEIQRYGDIVPGNVPRAPTQDFTFKGYFIPKGTTVIPLLTSVLRDEAYFKKPYEFYPEHFLDEQGHFKKNEAFIPFSLGKRSCAGETLARMELFLFFTALLQKFDFQPVPGEVLNINSAPGLVNAPFSYETCAVYKA